MAKRVTILDVASAAGVSRQTVTRAMNDMDDINPATRAKVLAAAERLGYRPSRFARNLVNRKKTHAMGLVLASFRNPYFTEIAADMLAVAGERGWQVVLASQENRAEDAIGLLTNQVDVVVGHFVGSDAAILAAAGGLPVVRLETGSTEPGVHSVDLDLESGVVEAVAELRARGARRFGMVDSALSQTVQGEYAPSLRRLWYERAAGDGFTGAVVGEETIAGGAQAFARLLRDRPETDAVLMFNDLMALGAVQHAHAHGIDVPGRVRIVGVDGLSLGEAVDPRLTSIALDRLGLASHTLDIVDELAAVDFARVPPIRRAVRSKLLWRESA
ncbi:LacI family DNA-binding transcriptional regulator [Glycomyces scopariae]|uniref:Transcriptional regulator, LacI family n=1 Tax=Glycomyces sambucus TaxID=380244 RepID=A0A1G9G0P5_9ACTN|nr:LacI family DNA-binding transcriptional regulator [Glycomyces sambucus]SDK94209.1 transcriptional regulator, LacI family [Glycomyces sambucus]